MLQIGCNNTYIY